MKTFRGKISRRNRIRKLKSKVIRYINMIDAPPPETKHLHTRIWRDIEEGLAYGLEPRYYKRSGNIYHPSIEHEFKDYHQVSMVNDRVLDETYEFLKDYIGDKALGFKDIIWIIGEDEFGEYFELELIK